MHYWDHYARKEEKFNVVLCDRCWSELRLQPMACAFSYVTAKLDARRYLPKPYERKLPPSRLSCKKCKVEMVKERTDTLEVVRKGSAGSYKIEADLWKCPECGIKVYAGFSERPIPVNSEVVYKRIVVDDVLNVDTTR